MIFSKQDKSPWLRLIQEVKALFNIELQEPIYNKDRSELRLSYKEESGVELDISSSGRGCQQVLLLLSYMLNNPGAVLLLDEPDAHLEILRQRDVYKLITAIAEESGSQVIAASHSEVVLQEAAEQDVVVAFVGKPHRMDVRSKGQVRKALEKIRMADYYMAEQAGWMLYLEGATDLSILQRLASRLKHPAAHVLGGKVPVCYIGTNLPNEAREHFHGLREAKNDLVGYALFDRLDKQLESGPSLKERMWKKREIENYITSPESLRNFILQGLEQDLFDGAERFRRMEAFEPVLEEIVGALKVLGLDPYGPDIKVTDEFLDRLMKRFFEVLGTPQRIFKRDYHGLAAAMPLNSLDPEVKEVLDDIFEVARNASPRR
jgi:hypothetical protein